MAGMITQIGRLSLPVVWSWALPTEPTSVTIYPDRAGRWFASFVVRLEVPEAPPAGVAVPVGDDGIEPKVPAGTLAA